MKVGVKVITKEQAWEMRHQVMWPQEEFDYIKLPDDDEGIHYGLFDGKEVISVVSLFVQGQDAQFRKLATLADRQGEGCGSKLLTHVLNEAKRKGVKHICCNARSNKVSFYEKFGLEQTQVVFNKGGQEYVVMERFY